MTSGLLKNPSQFTWEEIAFCKIDPKHQFGYTSIGKELKRFDSLCVRVYFCSQYFSECLLLAVLINGDKQFECKYASEQDTTFFNGFKDTKYTLHNCILDEIKMIFYMSSREKKNESRNDENFLSIYSFHVILTRSSQYGLFVNYMFILASPAQSVTRRFSK